MADYDKESEARPRGVDYRADHGTVRVRAPAGSVGWQPMAATLIALAVAVSCTVGLLKAAATVRSGDAVNPGPLFFLLTVGALAGGYCTALCLWTMLGHEKLTIRNGTILVSSPWLFGLQTKRFKASAVGSFICSGEACGIRAEGDSCCCRWSAVDYSLSFGYGGARIPVFSQLPRDAKDWLRDRLNNALRA